MILCLYGGGYNIGDNGCSCSDGAEVQSHVSYSPFYHQTQHYLYPHTKIFSTIDNMEYLVKNRLFPFAILMVFLLH